MSNLKPVNQSELTIGRLYCDNSRMHTPTSVIMRYLGRGEKGAHEFKYISGNNEYINEGDDIIRFGHYKKEPNWYWEVPKENAKIINDLVV